MTLSHPDITSDTRQHRIRAALRAALLPLLAALVVLGAIAPAEAAKSRKNSTRIVEPTSVAVADTACVAGDGGWDVTVTFAVSGGRYLNLGAPNEASKAINARDYDNVRGGGTRYVEATKHYYYQPGRTEDGQSAAVTDTFLYQHAIAPLTSPSKYVSSRTVRVLARDIDASFTCA